MPGGAKRSFRRDGTFSTKPTLYNRIAGALSNCEKSCRKDVIKQLDASCHSSKGERCRVPALAYYHRIQDRKLTHNTQGMLLSCNTTFTLLLGLTALVRSVANKSRREKCPEVPINLYQRERIVGTTYPIATPQTVEELYAYNVNHGASFNGPILPLEGKTSLVTLHQDVLSCELGHCSQQTKRGR